MVTARLGTVLGITSCAVMPNAQGNYTNYNRDVPPKHECEQSQVGVGCKYI
jgi:hypothetical protein